MSIEATAEALAPDTAMPVDAPVEANEVSEDSAMEALFDSISDGDIETDEPEADQPEPKPAEAGEEEAEGDAVKAEEGGDTLKPAEAPSDVPYSIKQHWADIPESARAAILDSQREMSRKLADQGRQVQGIAPIRDVLTQAVQELPALANMRPEQAAQEIMQLAKLSNDFTARPVETLMGYIQHHGLGDQMARALAGQPMGNQPNMAKEIQRLERELQRVSDPEFQRSTFEQFNTQAQVQNSVTEFASTAEHWGAVEDHMPAAIQYVQATLGDASPQDVLTKAYELAVSQFVPDAKAKQESATDKAAPTADPERSKAALKAKSANVQSRSSGKSRTMTEDELLASTFDKMQS